MLRDMLRIAAARRPRPHSGVSLYPVAAGRLSRRHLPTCSDYADQALDRFGLWAGGWMTLARLLRCQPWGTSGLDFVPQALPGKNRAGIWPWRYSRWQGTNDFPPVALAGPDAASRPIEELNCSGHVYLRSFAGVSNRSERMVALTFPDGARREFPTELAASTSPRAFRRRSPSAR